MHTTIPLSQGLALQFSNEPSEAQVFATSRLQRGLLLLDRKQPLVEEAVGFGVPVLKRGLRTIFPGSAHFRVQPDGPGLLIIADFKLNLVERFKQGSEGIVGNAWLYAMKDVLAAVIRRAPVMRGPLTAASSWLRRTFGWNTAYEEAGFETSVTVTYGLAAPAGKIQVGIDCSRVRSDVTEVVLMHEQGASTFDRYQDSSGLRLQGDEIGCWDEVGAAEAWFESSRRKLAFRLGRVEGARLFRGRELVGSRLAWAGFGYSFAPSLRTMQHELRISRLA
jgi:hypothetical protein